MSKDYTKKIKTPNALVKIVEDYKKKGKRVVQCHGVFDIVHLGHIRHFNEAKKEGDILLVTTTKDKYVKRGPGRPVFSDRMRTEALASLAMTDLVSIIDSPTATDFIRMVKPSVYAKGVEYKAKEKDITGKIYEEEDAIKSVGGRLAFTDDITFSSSSILNDYLEDFPQRTVRYIKAIGKRYPIDYVLESLESLKKQKVLVIGDTIVDQYHYCTPMGKSSKEHLVVNKYESREAFAGGALATANHVASVCGNVELLSLLGEKESHEKFILSKLSKNIKPKFFTRKGAQTIVKRRFVNRGGVQNKKLFEICYMQDDDIPAELETRILNYLDKKLKSYDLVVVSDFGHGLLTKKIIRKICSKSKYLALNVQTNSANIGFNLVTKYPKADVVCVDELELRYAAHDKFSNLRALAKKVYNQIGCKHIVATRGSYGSLSYSSKEGFHESPAFAHRVVDAIGAGDAFFAFVAPCYAAKMPQDLIAFVGNTVGSLAVQIVCNREPVNFVDLSKFITRLLK